MTDSFDGLLEDIEGTRWYQKRMLFFVSCPIFFFTPFAFLNQIFVLHIPDHWCTPPDHLEPTKLNLSVAEWKQTFLPVELGPDYMPRSSQCMMYTVTNETLPQFLSHQLPGNRTDLETVSCEAVQGYTYDRSEMRNTAVTENDWVCSKMTRATNLFTLGTVGLILGTAVFSIVADFRGRKLSFFLSTFFMLLFSIISIWLSHSYATYLALQMLSFATMLPLFQSPMSITTEVSTVNGRGLVIGVSCIAWSIGGCALPLVAWLIPRWKVLRVVSVVPFFFIFACWKIIPESPRWLVSRGRTTLAKKIVENIARVNKTDVPKDIDQRLQAIAEETASEPNYGYLSLFSSRQMALRTVFVTMGFTASAFVYYQLVINIGNMAGTIFLNMFLLCLVEGPGCALGVIMADKFGRRWTHTCLLLVNSILFFILMWVVYSPNLRVLVIILCMWIKLNISGTFVVAYVQAMEVFPTCIRQCGIGFATLISQTISIGGPYVIYLGATDLKLPYLVMFLVCLLGSVCVSFIPETLGLTLPESIHEAARFGRADRYFSYLPHRRQESEMQSLNSERYDDDEVVDWNVVMRDAFGGRTVKKSEVDANLIKHLVTKHYKQCNESHIF